MSFSLFHHVDEVADAALAEVTETIAWQAIGKRNQGEALRVIKRHFPYRCCAVCGMQQKACLTVAHLNHKADDNTPENLAELCQTHHRMYDGNLYTREAIQLLQKHWQQTMGVADFSACMKEAGPKAAETRRVTAAKNRQQLTIEKS